MKTKFHSRKIKQKFRKECAQCTKIKRNVYNSENSEKIKIYRQKNPAKKNLYGKKRRKSDFIFILAHNIRCRTSRAFKSQSVKKFKQKF